MIMLLQEREIVIVFRDKELASYHEQSYQECLHKDAYIRGDIEGRGDFCSFNTYSGVALVCCYFNNNKNKK